MRFGRTLIAAALLQLVGVAGASAADLRLEQYFAGHTVATGHFGAINGVSRDFKVKLTGTSSGKHFPCARTFAMRTARPTARPGASRAPDPTLIAVRERMWSATPR